MQFESLREVVLWILNDNSERIIDLEMEVNRLSGENQVLKSENEELIRENERMKQNWMEDKAKLLVWEMKAASERCESECLSSGTNEDQVPVDVTQTPTPSLMMEQIMIVANQEQDNIWLESTSSSHVGSTSIVNQTNPHESQSQSRSMSDLSSEASSSTSKSRQHSNQENNHNEEQHLRHVFTDHFMGKDVVHQDLIFQQQVHKQEQESNCGTEESPVHKFKCNFNNCGKLFLAQRNLTQHMISHTGNSTDSIILFSFIKLNII